MHVDLRPFDPATDYPALAALRNTVRSEPTTAERLAREDQRQPAAELRRRMVAVGVAGNVVGTSSLLRYAWMRPGEVEIEVIVLREARRQGTGATLYDDAQRVAVEHGAGSYTAAVRDNDDDALRFAQRRGFRVRRHEFESTLDLARFDESAFAGVTEAVEATGIRFTTMAAEGDDEAARRRLYAIHRAAAADIPGSDGNFSPYEDYERFVFRADWYRPDLQLVAVDGDRYAGVALLHLFPSTRCMYNEFTGVDRAYRGRHLALALKLLGIRAALANDAAYMRTDNDAENAPILAVNQKLGYQRVPGIYQLRAEIP